MKKDPALDDLVTAPANAPPLDRVTLTGAVRLPPIPLPDQPIQLFNRELSWIEFNRRVLAEAANPAVPLLERVKFLSICASNLDEFTQVRAGGIRELVAAGLTEKSRDGLTPKQQLKAVRDRTRRFLAEMHDCMAALVPELEQSGLWIVRRRDLRKTERVALAEIFRKDLAPILTPRAVDSGHPFPTLSSLALNLAVTLESGRGEEAHVALITIPSIVPRFIRVPGEESRFLPVELLIAEHAGMFFPGLRVSKTVAFRVIRFADMTISEDEVQDLLKTVESELRLRDRKEIVWIEVAGGETDAIVDMLVSATKASRDAVFQSPGLLKVSDLMEIYAAFRKPSLLDPPFNPRIPARLATTEEIFSIVRREDVFLHRPYDSFSTVVEFVQTASEDPDVLAIKQTLYRVDEGSPIVAALAKAALAGKQVTALVELQARFDEKRNIAWARQLEEAGVQVVYGMVGMKTHCKLCLVVRREAGSLRQYLHLSTGNYNARTARLYTDVDLFTADEAFCEDAAQLMNLLTGFSIASVQDIFDRNTPELRWNRFVIAPTDYHRWALEMIDRETRHASEGRPAQIMAKMNALVDPTVIQALYRASRAGVSIDLAVRGTCCLVPGVKDLSENIRVTSVIDRFLEHSRIFLFRNGGETEIYVSTGDWMPRNFFRRFEVTFPLLDPRLRARVEKEILLVCLGDNVKGWSLQSDGFYQRRTGEPPLRSQERFIEIARAEAVAIAPYEEAIRKPAALRRRAKRPRKKEKTKS